MEEEIELPEFNPRERVKQQISVPFLWEQNPGTPKRVLVISKPVPSAFSCPSPARLVVSVPFQWEEKPGKPLPDTSPFRLPSDHAEFSVSSRSLNPFGAEGEEYSLGFDLDAFGFQDDHKASGVAVCADGSKSSHHDTWYSFSETADYSSSSQDTSAQEFMFPVPPPEKGDGAVVHGDRLNDPLSPPRSTLTLGELIMLSRKLSCRPGAPVDVGKKSFPSMELIKKFLIVCS